MINMRKQRSLINAIYNNSLTLTELVKLYHQTYNAQLLNDDFWYALTWKYIYEHHGTVFGDLLVKCMSDAENNIVTALHYYEATVLGLKPEQELLEELIATTEVTPDSNLLEVLYELKPKYKYYQHSQQLFQRLSKGLFMKMFMLTEKQYRLVNDLANDLCSSEDSEVGISELLIVMKFYREMSE